MPEPPERRDFLRRAQRFFVYVGGIYTAVLALLTVPLFQNHLIFLHSVRWPPNADFGAPEKYGLAPQKAFNVNITTTDNVHLGAWFILSDAFYKDAYGTAPSFNATLIDEFISTAMRKHPTILYFHGNAGTRAVSLRVDLYKAYTTRLNMNVLAVDYRGFADSSGSPTEEGLLNDARGAWEWAMEHGARGEDLMLVGQSLGTGVVAQLAQQLDVEGLRPKVVVLISPYSSVKTLLETYNVFGWLPLLGPLQIMPTVQNLLLRFLKTTFDTKAALPNVKADIVILHAKDDFDVPLSHSIALFDTLLEPALPPPAMSMEELRQQSHIPEKWEEWLAGEELRRHARANVVQVDEIERFGKISRFQRSWQGDGKVVFFESLWGAHERIGIFEGVVDIMGQAMSLTE